MTHAALALRGVSKRFSDVVALRDASLVVRPGTVHALLGENGAGKSTLVNVAFGLVAPDAGEVQVNGVARTIASPAAAIALGLGMVHQHFRLVSAMTVAENVALGRGGRFDRRAVAREIERVGIATGLRIDPHARVGDLGVAAQQRVEIVKALVRGARVLVLDEPTAVLAPDEADALLAWVRQWATTPGAPSDMHDLHPVSAESAGAAAVERAAVLITHRLREAGRYADDVTVLRRGATVLATSVAAAEESTLLAAMLGAGASAIDDAIVSGATHARAGAPPHSHDAPARAPLPHPIPADRGAPLLGRSDATRGVGSTAVPGTPAVLRLTNAGYRDARGVVRLHPTSLDAHGGEILGIAAVEGAGHHELLRLLAGRLRPTEGSVTLPDHVGFVPEDRHCDALLLDDDVRDNVLLRDAGARRGWLRPGRAATLAHRLVAEHDVRGAAPGRPVRALSGGNQQKLVLARELADGPAALVAESPTRGLDVRAAADVVARLRAAARDDGAAVVLFLPDLDALLAIADRIVVVHAGRVHDAPRNRAAIGRLLVGAG